MRPEAVIEKIKIALPNAEVVASGEECSFAVEVTSPQFEGKSPVQRHRLVNEIFKEEIASGALHALSIKTKVPS